MATRSEAAIQRWARELGGWAIPDDILCQAPANPWSMPPGLFRAEPEPVETPSRARALAALGAVRGPGDGPSVLDVGCGAGRAALALAPPATRLIGVDALPDMLTAFQADAYQRGVGVDLVAGVWPDVADQVPNADVVICHHVAYNVADLASFARALHSHARRRVVMELTSAHPLSWLAPLWLKFWGLERPPGPTAADALAVLVEAGIPARMDEWQDVSRRGMQVLTRDERTAFVRTRLCLRPDRDAEIAEALDELDLDSPRSVATLWWNVD